MTKALFELGKEKEGIRLAKLLVNEKNAMISSSAKALILAHETKKSRSSTLQS